jgi:hypothetical protein
MSTPPRKPGNAIINVVAEQRAPNFEIGLKRPCDVVGVTNGVRTP